ncbi:Protein kinase C conserved region 2 (CalB), partial [Blomia tropicalis]
MFSVPTEMSTITMLTLMAGVLMTFILIFIAYRTNRSCFQSVSKCWCCSKSTSLNSKRRISKELEIFNGGVDTIRTKNRTIQRQISICQDDCDPINYEPFKRRSTNILKQQAIYASLALKNNTKTLESLMNNKEGKTGKDLISLAEKGRIGKQTSTEGSASSETGSAEDNTGFILEKKSAILRRLKTASTESKESSTDVAGHKYQMLSNYLDNYESDTQSSNLPDFSPNTTISEPVMNGPIKCGRLEASFAYDAPSKRLCVTVIQANEIPFGEPRAGVNQVYVQVILLPHKKTKYRTKSKPIFCPVFNESFTFNRINPEGIMNLGLRFRVYSLCFARKNHLIGESRLLFACMKPQQQETKLWFSLETPLKRPSTDLRSDVSSLARTDSTSSQSLYNTLPELLLGLAYNGTTGRLSVTVMKGSQFRCISTRTPDTYMKITLVSSSGQEIARCKTSVCRAQPNPHFKETFIFQVALFQLPDVSLMLFAYNKRSIKRKELIGWLALGCNSSGDEELSHWNDMRDSKGEQVARWHVLLE